MIYVQRDGNACYLYLIVTNYTQVLNYHNIPPKDGQIYPNKNSELKGSIALTCGDIDRRANIKNESSVNGGD
jgi:hypothetical protein